ncbi:MAG: FHA domain-containing protein [Ruminococcus sp.]|nr:FHA domain-containing protein [Ruminococcus sp.]
MGFKTVYSEDKTFLIYSLNKKREINFSQLQRFDNEGFRDYFLPCVYTRTTLTSKIRFDISGLTALSEYLKMNLTQETYFDVIRGIQQIISFCHKKSISYGNLVCDPRYMYYHNTLNKILMAYVPLKDPNAVSDNIPQCLIKIHKTAKNNVSVTDQNYMNKYENYLAQFSSTIGRKDKVPAFSPDSLLHFFNENRLNAGEEAIAAGIGITVNTIQKHGLSIYDYISDSSGNNTNVVAPLPTPPNIPAPLSPTPSPPPVAPPHVTKSGGTVVTSRAKAYLTDASGKRFYITSTPFTIGRDANNHLQLQYETVSGSHAKILTENGAYYIEDVSLNGTYQNDYYNRISYSRLSDGDILYFDSYQYQFHLEENRPAPSPVPEQKKSQTLLVPRHQQMERPLAYITKADGSNIPVMHFPFQDSALPGVVFGSDVSSGRTILYVQNCSCASLLIEGETVPVGESVSIFSGCSLFINGENYIFSVEN